MKIYSYEGKRNVCGEKIREMRVKNRMSQSDLAAKLQVNGVIMERDSISRIESGTRFVADYELYIFAQVFAICAIVAGRSLSRSGRGVKGSLKLAVRGV